MRRAPVCSALFVLTAAVLSCGPKPINLSVNSSDQGLKTLAESSVVLSLQPTERVELTTIAAPGAEALSFIDGKTLSVASSIGSFVLPINNGQLTAPEPAELPSFAAGKKLLSLAERKSDFWLIEPGASETVVTRPLSSVPSPLPATLPPHMKVSLPTGLTLLGFGQQTIVFKSSTAVWIVVRREQQLTATQVAFPQPKTPPIAAGQIVSNEIAIWLADTSSLWSLVALGNDWKARRYKPDFTTLSGNLERLAAVFELKGNQLILSGPAVAIAGGKVYSSGITAAKTDVTPAITPMTFAEARAFCDGCHASTSTNATAKDRLSGTENISTWMSNKERIYGSIRDGVMPKEIPISASEKQRLLLFADNPKL